jgi:TatD DNase family protein
VWFDTHAHLSDAKFDADRAEIVERCYDNGVVGIVEIADGPDEWAKAKNLAHQNQGRMWWAAGLHPYHADKSNDTLWTELKRIADNPQFVAVGEIGLDYAKCPISPDVQQRAFHRGIGLALELDKPMIIHCRDGYKDLMPILRTYAGAFKNSSPRSPGVIHCFSGDQNAADELIEMDFFLGVDGPLTYPSANALRQVIHRVPLKQLVIETDSPYLPPQTHRGQRNEPVHIAAVGEALATLKNQSSKFISAELLQNSQRLYRLK